MDGPFVNYQKSYARLNDTPVTHKGATYTYNITFLLPIRATWVQSEEYEKLLSLNYVTVEFKSHVGLLFHCMDDIGLESILWPTTVRRHSWISKIIRKLRKRRHV